jgi:hypothetical protein
MEINHLKEEELSLEELKSKLSYNPETGIFRWKITTPWVKVGDTAGGSLDPSDLSRGLGIGIGRKRYYLHRLAWFYMTGKWPKGFLDHIDRNAQNNKWSNLREATKPQNGWNVGLSKRNTTGHKGIRRRMDRDGRYQVGFGYHRKIIYVGMFDTLEEAITARDKKRKELYGEFAVIGEDV